METMLQTKVNEHAQQDWLAKVYPRSTKSKEQLIQLDKYNVSSYVFIDCCGWHYQSLWPNLNIFGVETLQTAKDYKLERSKFQGLVNDQDYNNIKWPSINAVNCAVIFDYSPILKYKTVEDIVAIIASAAKKYQPQIVVFNSFTILIDDSRFVDRFINLSQLLIPGFVVTSFLYNETAIEISYKKISNI